MSIERREINPATVMAPGPYSHGVEVKGASRTLYVSGQVGQRKDGSVAEDIGAQTKIAFENLSAILADADMTIANVTKLTIYLVEPADTPGFLQAGGPFLPAPPPAITLLYVKGLASPALRVEVEAIAAA